MRVAIVGAGPGDPELITVRGQRLIAAADLIIYAGSLVNPEVLRWKKPDTTAYDSAAMTLEEVCAIYHAQRDQSGLIVRLHTGDPSIYGAIQEQIDYCSENGIEVEVVPGVSSVFAAAAALKRELTLPGVSQTVILTRAAGRTPVPESERLDLLATHGATFAIFLSATLIDSVVRDLTPHYGGDAPVRIVQRASWSDERVLTATLSNVAAKAREAGVRGQAMILIGRALAPETDEYQRSRLYDPGFTHGRRSASQ